MIKEEMAFARSLVYNREKGNLGTKKNTLSGPKSKKAPLFNTCAKFIPEEELLLKKLLSSFCSVIFVVGTIEFIDPSW